MADISKAEKINTVLAKLPIFTPYGWKCIGVVAVLLIIARVAM